MIPPPLDQMKRLGHAVFDSGLYNLNIIGIRHNRRTAGLFDDLIGCVYQSEGGWIEHWWPATTDPSPYYLKHHPQNPNGSAILVPGQYRGVYSIDLHGQGQYEALCQRNGPVRVYRDANRDEVLDMDPGTVESGFFGINIHAPSSAPYSGSGADRTASAVGPWSAGCQVFARDVDFRAFMALVRRSRVTYGPRFTYTLLTEDQAHAC